MLFFLKSYLTFIKAKNMNLTATKSQFIFTLLICFSFINLIESTDAKSAEKKVTAEDQTIKLWDTLKKAIENGQLEVFNFLIRDNLPLLKHKDSDGMNLLMYACANKQSEIVKIICVYHQEDIDINTENNNGETALVISAKKIDYTSAQILINAKASATDSKGRLFYGYTDLKFRLQMRAIYEPKMLGQNDSSSYYDNYCSIQ